MKSIILLLCLISFAPFAIYAEKYKHKSEAEIKALTPAQRVDEWVNEQVHHRFDVLDDQTELLRKYVTPDGLKALPRLIEIIDEYDPTRASGRRGHKGDRFDACWLMLGYIDDFAVRLRGSEEGKRATNALEQAVGRMRAAGYGQKDNSDAKQYVFELAEGKLKYANGINFTDEAIRDTFWVQHKIQMSDQELLEFSNFLIARDSTYPSWSERDFIKDFTRADS